MQSMFNRDNRDWTDSRAEETLVLSVCELPMERTKKRQDYHPMEKSIDDWLSSISSKIGDDQTNHPVTSENLFIPDVKPFGRSKQ